jgi:hypothetical protein
MKRLLAILLAMTMPCIDGENVKLASIFQTFGGSTRQDGAVISSDLRL